METRRSTINCLDVPASESMCGANIAVLKMPHMLYRRRLQSAKVKVIILLLDIWPQAPAPNQADPSFLLTMHR